jgi:nicotinamide-nucleotide amidase
MERFFKERGIAMPSNNLKQALAPKESIILDNPVGTAPGLALEKAGVLYVLVPGPPNEFKEMVTNQVLPLLRQKAGVASVIKSRVLKLCGIGESKVDQMVAPLLKSRNPTLAPTAKFSEIHLRITAKAADSRQADRMNGEMEDKVRAIVGDYIYGCDDETLPEAVGKLLEAKNLTLALAEISSGGYLSHMLTTCPHCSSYFKFAVVAGVAGLEELLDVKIPRPEETAETLAGAVRQKARADIGMAMATEGGDPCTPSGALTIATSFKEKTLLKKILLPGDGAAGLRQRAVQLCLVLLWHTLKSRP